MGLLEHRLPEGDRYYGILAEFESPGDLLRACRQVRDAGYTRWDAHSPFPVHGVDRAMGLRPSVLPWFVLVLGLGGAIGGFALQAWVHSSAYALVISGKPFFSWPAYIPITFELGVLFAAGAAVLFMLGLNQLPALFHPLFNSKRFEEVTDDKFFISIESWDPKFDPRQTQEFLKQLQPVHIELIENDPLAEK